MKKISMLLAAALALGSCFKDKGNYDYTPMTPIAVAGIEESYSRNSSNDRLAITPTVTTQGTFDYSWLIYPVLTVDGPIVPADTLATTKDLDLTLDYNIKPGAYYLLFNVRSRETGYTETVEARLSVVTPNMTGWYLTKQVGSQVDIDFYNDDVAIPDWIAAQNDGLKLGGNVLKTLVLRDYKESPLDETFQRGLMVMTDSDIATFRVEDGGLSNRFDDGMFFMKPEPGEIQGAAFNVGFSILYLLIDGILYTKPLTNQSGVPIAPSPATSNYLTRVVTAFAPLTFDENSLSIKNNGSAFPERGDAPVSANAMDARPVWMEGYQSPRPYTMALMQGVSDPARFTVLNIRTDYTYYMAPPSWSAVNPIESAKTLPAGSKLAAATMRGGNFDIPMIYFADGPTIYKYDYANNTETLLFTLPAGETVTALQHLKYPLNPPAGTSFVNELVVATTDGSGNYKVWMSAMQSTGDAALPTAPAYTGTGVVKCVNYLQNTDGSNVYY